MFGWSRLEAVRASWMNLSRASGSAVSPGGQELEGDLPFEAEVFGLVDDAHAAAPELADDAVLAGDRLAGLDLRGGDSERASRIIPHLSLHPVSP